MVVYLVWDTTTWTSRPVVQSTLKTFTRVDPHWLNFELQANVTTSISRVDDEDDVGDKYGDSDFLDYYVKMYLKVTLIDWFYMIFKLLNTHVYSHFSQIIYL